jgi:hypothetical protein
MTVDIFMNQLKIAEDVRQRMQERFDGLEAQATLLDPDEEKTLAEPVYNIAELVNKVTPENRPDPKDIDFGAPVGREKL